MDLLLVRHDVALNRLGHLLPIGAFMRIASVQPVLQRQCPPIRCFESIETNDRSDGVLALTFDAPVDSGEERRSVTYESPEAVLNEGPVECKDLILNRTDGVPVEAIKVTVRVGVNRVESGVLPFLDSPERYVTFAENMPENSDITLTAVCASVRPELLTLPWAAFPDSSDFSKLKLTRRQGRRLKMFHMTVPNYECLILLLQKNVAFLAQSDFCEIMLFEPLCDQKPHGNLLVELLRAIRPFCPHKSENEGGKRIVINGIRTFHLAPECTVCNPDQSSSCLIM